MSGDEVDNEKKKAELQLLICLIVALAFGIIVAIVSGCYFATHPESEHAVAYTILWFTIFFVIGGVMCLCVLAEADKKEELITCPHCHYKFNLEDEVIETGLKEEDMGVG